MRDTYHDELPADQSIFRISIFCEASFLQVVPRIICFDFLIIARTLNFLPGNLITISHLVLNVFSNTSATCNKSCIFGRLKSCNNIKLFAMLFGLITLFATILREAKRQIRYSATFANFNSSFSKVGVVRINKSWLLVIWELCFDQTFLLKLWMFLTGTTNNRQ